MNLKNFYFRILRKFTKVKELTIHAEAIVREDLWNTIQKLIGKGFIWFVITPANYDYCKAYFNLKGIYWEFIKSFALSKNQAAPLFQRRLLCEIPHFP